MAWVKMDESLLDLPIQMGADVRVLMALDLLGRGKPLTARIEQVAQRAGLSARTARRSLQSLERAGVIEVQHNYHEGSRVASTYSRGAVTADRTPEVTDDRTPPVTPDRTLRSQMAALLPTDKDQTTTQTKTQTNTQTTTAVREPNWSRGEGATAAAPAYRYNQFAGQCCICEKDVMAEAGTLLLDKATDKMRPAHHYEECRKNLSAQERADFLKGLANTTTNVTSIREQASA